MAAGPHIIVIFNELKPNTMKTEVSFQFKAEMLEQAEHYAASEGYNLHQLLAAYIDFLAGKDVRDAQAREDLHLSLHTLHQEFEHHIDQDAKKDYRRYLIEKYK